MGNLKFQNVKLIVVLIILIYVLSQLLQLSQTGEQKAELPFQMASANLHSK